MPPYRMSVRQLKQAIRDRHEALGHAEFLGCIMAKRDAALLGLYLDSDPTVSECRDHSSGVTYCCGDELLSYWKALSRFGLVPDGPRPR
jgi:hypothetical protein